MVWNWQQKDWPQFRYNAALLVEFEDKFLHKSGIFLGAYQHIAKGDRGVLIADVISDEALKTSEIEGEYLNRDSVQSSIRREFGLAVDKVKASPAEQGIVEMMVDLYRNYAVPLTHEILFDWHKMLMNGRRGLDNIGGYRSHIEPMQVISGPLHEPKVHFEAPPSKIVKQETERFIAWFNKTAPGGEGALSPLTRSGIAHFYFVCIHPFEDGNGRIGRAIAEKALSQWLGQPTLIALSHIIHQHRKKYYDMLEKTNKENEITPWLLFFAQMILAAQDHTQQMVSFLIEKTKLHDKLRGQLNPRQEKVIARMFREGPDGFKGGLSAENYLSITKTSRATATRDLHDLVDKQALVSKGMRKSTRYYLNLNSM